MQEQERKGRPSKPMPEPDSDEEETVLVHSRAASIASKALAPLGGRACAPMGQVYFHQGLLGGAELL